MDLWKTVRILMRRWYVAVPLILLALTGGLLVREGVEPGYTVSANVLVLPPSAGAVSTTAGVQVVPVNPLLGFNGSTQIAARALEILAQSTTFRSKVEADAGLASYAVATAEGNPILGIQVESISANVTVGGVSVLFTIIFVILSLLAVGAIVVGAVLFLRSKR